MTHTIEEKINSLLLEKFSEPDFSDCFIVEIIFGKKNDLEIYIDSDSGMDFAKCRTISRGLEAIIDEQNWLGEQYSIDVSSPGVDRPLKFQRQYDRNIGRDLEVTMADGIIKLGKLLEVGEETFTIEYLVKTKEGKKTIKTIVQDPIAYTSIKKALVQVSFK
jgi:ribosome maturation factor RimP